MKYQWHVFLVSLDPAKGKVFQDQITVDIFA